MWIASCSRFQRDHTQSRVNSLVDELAFPRTAKYDERWIRENALGENALCLVESLARHLPFSSGMRVLELGCGKATSSIFLAREFDVQVWATDSSTSATENFHRAIALESESRVFPMRVDAHSLPFAKEFFDAVVAIDSYLYFGTDERYLPYVVQFIKPDGFIGLVDIGFRREIRSVEEAPEYLRPQYEKYWSSIHTVEWWKQHWQKTGLVDVQCAQFLPESDQLLRNYWVERSPDQDKDPIMRAVPNDEERLIGLFCLVARKR
jgi:cyclopropane fatty-acyl-phospholipid synthase-like methyltransferase